MSGAALDRFHTRLVAARCPVCNSETVLVERIAGRARLVVAA